MAKFAKGQSGNPRGRPKGRTLADELRRAVKPRFAEIVGSLVSRAVDGDTQAASLLLSRLVAPLKPAAEPIRFGGADLIEKAESVIDGLGRGELSPDTAKNAIGALCLAARVQASDYDIDVKSLSIDELEQLAAGRLPRRLPRAIHDADHPGFE